MRLSQALNQVSRAVMLLHCYIAREKEEAALHSLQTRLLLHGATLGPCLLMLHESAKSHWPALLETKCYKTIKRDNYISPFCSGSPRVAHPLRLGMQGHPEKGSVTYPPRIPETSRWPHSLTVDPRKSFLYLLLLALYTFHVQLL